jgi:hypothetical protein
MINFTTDGTPPVPGNTPGFSSPLYTGPITVAGRQVTKIRAVASQLDPNVTTETDATYVCKAPSTGDRFGWIDITVATGGDDARHNSQVIGELWPPGTTTPSFTILLKPSDVVNPDTTDQNGNVTWQGWTSSEQQIGLGGSPPVSSLGAINFDLTQHYSFPDTGDNWDIQGVSVYVFNKHGNTIVDPVCLLYTGDLSNTPRGGATWIARLTETAPTKVFPFTASPKYGICGDTTEGAQLTVNNIVQPLSAAGTFNLQIDGVTRAANLHGGSTGPLNVSIGGHRVGETAGVGTNLGNFNISIGGDCDAAGNLALAAEDFKTCTISNTVPPPPPPPHQCGGGAKCCERADNGGCNLCVGNNRLCP